MGRFCHRPVSIFRGNVPDRNWANIQCCLRLIGHMTYYSVTKREKQNCIPLCPTTGTTGIIPHLVSSLVKARTLWSSHVGVGLLCDGIKVKREDIGRSTCLVIYHIYWSLDFSGNGTKLSYNKFILTPDINPAQHNTSTLQWFKHTLHKNVKDILNFFV